MEAMMQNTGHPAFADLDEWIGDVAAYLETSAKKALDYHLEQAAPGDVDRIIDYRYAGDVSKTGATLKFEIEVFLTPLDN
jgi:hypothetical protein